MSLMRRMARRGTKTGGKASYGEQSLRQAAIDKETIASMRQQLNKIYNSVYAWWRLSPEQQQALDTERDSAEGRFGGTPGRAPYFWIQEGSVNPEGASGAGIHPTRFVEQAIEGAAERMADAIVKALNGS